MPSASDISRWQQRDPFEKKASGLFSRAKRIAGRPIGYVSGRQLHELLDATKWTCAWCGCPLTLDTVTFDHLTPLSRSGRHAVWNLVPACRHCNAQKGDLDATQYAVYLALSALPPEQAARAALRLTALGLQALLDAAA